MRDLLLKKISYFRRGLKDLYYQISPPAPPPSLKLRWSQKATVHKGRDAGVV